MTDFIEKLRLKEMAEEDRYFARRDLELIDALRKKRLAELARCSSFGAKRQAKRFEDRFQRLNMRLKKRRGKLWRGYRALLDEINRACRHRV